MESLLEFWSLLGWGLYAWTIVFVSMFLLGLLLSALTLMTGRRLATSRQEVTSHGALLLRTIYKALMGIGAVGYYLSLPLLGALLLLGGCSLIYLFLAARRTPIQLIVLILVGVGASLMAIAKSLLVRQNEEVPHDTLDFKEAPGLRKVLNEVAARVGTRPVDTVFLTPGTELAVFERGGLWKKLQGQGERCLILGVAVLDEFEVQSFKSVLAHEYGHFSNKDTAGGQWALIARQALVTMGQALAESGAAVWYNPAWWFFRGYLAAFLRISQGASRLQEILADRIAIFQFGSNAFVRGYEHVLRQSVRFNAQLHASVTEALKGKIYVRNFYTFEPATPVAHEQVEEGFRELLEEQPHAFDSHPPSKDRLTWAKMLAVPDARSTTALNVWDLFLNKEGIQKRMTETLKRNISVNHEVVFASKPEAVSQLG